MPWRGQALSFFRNQLTHSGPNGQITPRSASRVRRMWVPSEDDAVEMFARHFEARHRGGAIAKATEAASTLKAAGDEPGHKVWIKVADRLRLLRNADRITSRRQFETT